MEIEEEQTKKSSYLKSSQDRSQQPWVEKYRPTDLSDLVSHSAIIQTMNQFVNNKRMPNLLFYGPPGTGKTSTIIACAKQMYESQFASMVLELNASDERGIGVIRNNIKTFASMQNINFLQKSQKMAKLIILDEADSMTKTAQFALRRIIEKYAKNTRFCLICNYVSKIIPALQSRCTRFKFKQIPIQDASQRIKNICLQEKLDITDDGLEALFQLCEGDMRKIVNMLQSIGISNQNQDQINSQFIYRLTGNATPEDMNDILNILMNSQLIQALNKISLIKSDKGIALQTIIKELANNLIKLDLPQEMKMFLIKRISEIEYRMSISCNENIQLASLISAFIEIRTLIQ